MGAKTGGLPGENFEQLDYHILSLVPSGPRVLQLLSTKLHSFTSPPSGTRLWPLSRSPDAKQSAFRRLLGAPTPQTTAGMAMAALRFTLGARNLPPQDHVAFRNSYQSLVNQLPAWFPTSKKLLGSSSCARAFKDGLQAPPCCLLAPCAASAAPHPRPKHHQHMYKTPSDMKSFMIRSSYRRRHQWSDRLPTSCCGCYGRTKATDTTPQSLERSRRRSRVQASVAATCAAGAFTCGTGACGGTKNQQPPTW